MPHRPPLARHPHANLPARRPLNRALRLALIGLMAGGLPIAGAQAAEPASASAQAGRVQVDIAAGPLSEVLARYAAATQVALSFDASALQGLQSPGLRGEFSVPQGFEQLLASSGYEAIPADTGGYRLRKRPQPVRKTETTLNAVTVTAQAASGARTENTGSYATSEVSTAKGQALREIPQTVSVITRQQMEDQNMTTLDEVMAFMPGVTTSNLGQGGRGGSYYTRGLAVTKTLVDGTFASGLVSGGLNQEGSNIAAMPMIDHVEVLRGADGLYSGVGDSSGTINLVRKKPLKEFQAKFNLAAGSWDTYEGEADLTGPLAFDGKLRGRLVLARKDAGSFTDNADSHRDLVYAVGELDLGPRTMLTLGGNYTHEWGFPTGSGLLRNADGSDPGFSRSTSLVTPWSTYEKENTEAFLQLDHAFNDDWKAAASINYLRAENSRYLGKVESAADAAIIRLRGGSYPAENWSYDLNLKGKGELFGHAYDILLGTDGMSTKTGYDFLWNFTYAGSAYNRDSVPDPLNVDWSLYPEPLAYARESYGQLEEEQVSAYGRVKMQLVDSLHLVLGGRYSNYKYKYAYTGYDAAGQVTSSSVSKYDEQGIFTPYGGLVYDLGDSWSAYASVAKIFRSQASAMKGPPPGNSPVDPLEGRNYEIGVKGELAGGRYTTALALYRLERTGQSARDNRYPFSSDGGGLSCCYLNTGEVISQGFDSEIQGEILPRLQVSASYVFNTVRDKTNGDVAYNTTVSPKHLLKLWGKYQLPGEWARLSVGGGVTAQSKTYAQGSTYYYEQAGYSVWNLFAQYRIDANWQLGLNVNNLFDRKYYTSISDPTYGNYYGDPFNWMLSLRGAF